MVVGEISYGAIGIIMSIFGVIGSVIGVGWAWWIKNDRQNIRFELIVAKMQEEIKANRDNVNSETKEIKDELKRSQTDMTEIKTQLAIIMAMGHGNLLNQDLPHELKAAVGNRVAAYMRQFAKRDR